MKIRLKKDLLDFPAGSTFKYAGDCRWEFLPKNDEVVPIESDGWLEEVLDSYKAYPKWFERIDETPLYWEPRKGDDIYFINEEGVVRKITNNLGMIDLGEIGNAFPTEEAAQAHVEYLKALTRVRKYIQENAYKMDVDVDEDGFFYEVIYDHDNQIFSPMLSKHYRSNPVLPLFSHPQDAQNIIDNHEDDLKTIFGVES